MFNGGTKNQSAKPVKKSEVRDNSVTILTSGCHFTGKLYCNGATRIGGSVDGEIISKGLLIIEERAVITATIKAEEVVIQGSVEGKIEAESRLELCQTGKFSGDIVTRSLVVREGASFNGRSVMSQPKKQGAASKDDMAAIKVGAGLETMDSSAPEVTLP